MKKILALSLLLAGLSSASAQGTLQFTVTLNGANEVPPSNSPYYVSGALSLAGDALNFEIGMAFTNINDIFYPTGAGIYGPAAPGQNGPLIFDLSGYYHPVINPPPGTYGGYSYAGGLSLTSQQISDLEAGLWYVNFVSSAYPSGEIRGQIVPVPEPSTWALMILGGCLVGYLTGKKQTG
jgi:hypothetical protein